MSETYYIVPSSLTPGRVIGALVEASAAIEELKWEVGHGGHRNWRIADSPPIVYCGCGEELVRAPGG